MSENNSFSVLLPTGPTSPAISNHAIIIYKWVVLAGSCQILDVFGIVTNIINIICFLKQGFKEPINVSLFGLAVSDLCSLVSLAAVNGLYTLSLCSTDQSFDPIEVAYLVALPHFAFALVSTWITAIITMERCLCVISPLKVKQLVTPTRVKLTLVCIFIILVSTEAPVYFVNRLDMKFSPLRNRTIIGIVPTENQETVQRITFTINNFILPLLAFIVIIICTVVLVFNLRMRTAWRKASTTAVEVSSRNEKVAKMVVMISTLFIVCFIPCVVSMLALAFEPGLNVGGSHFNIGVVIFGIGLLMESVNSSTNIFIYYHMSSKYRDVFSLLFFSYNNGSKTQA